LLAEPARWPPVAVGFADAGRGGSWLGLLLLVLLAWGLSRSAAIPRRLIAGIVVLDCGIQGAQISNQTAIYGCVGRPQPPDDAYMVSVFLGGSSARPRHRVYTSFGWTATCALGAAGRRALTTLPSRVWGPDPQRAPAQPHPRH